MPSTYLSGKHAALAANGTADGIADITSNAGWLPGATVWLSATGEDSLECYIVEQISSDKVRLRQVDHTSKGGFTDISAYTTAKNSRLSLEGQVVRVRGPFEGLERF